MNAETVLYIHKHIIPATLALLPGRMDSPEARAMLLAIGLQESDGFSARVQYGGGPAHGFWQFEKGGGVKAVLSTPATLAILTPVLHTLNYSTGIPDCYEAIEHNDVLACAFARLLLWTVPGKLPDKFSPAIGWAQYTTAWRPGKPRPSTWSANFMEGWRTVEQE